MALDSMVKAEAMHWGDSVSEDYHGAAGRNMDREWNTMIWPFLSKHNPDLTSVVDFAVGRGRNTVKLLQAGAKSVTVVDVNAENITYCKEHFKDKPVNYVLNNGLDLKDIPDASHTLFYTWDAMVHFDALIIGTYMSEIFRILAPGGKAFIHHSAYSASPGADFRSNPHWRNYMTPDLFKHFAIKAGFEVVEQQRLTWGIPDIDCLSLLRKPE